MSFTVSFRVDASIQMGSGHIMRCLTLADELRERGATCVFISRPHIGHMLDLVRMRGYKAITLTPPAATFLLPATPSHAAWLGTDWVADAEQTRQAMDDQVVDWLVVDHYGLDFNWEHVLRPLARQIMVIDDLADRTHDCDLLLDQNYFGAESYFRYENCVSPNTLKLIGPKYALLKSVFPQLRSLMPSRDGSVGGVLVFMGGSDPTNQTAKVLRALTDQRLLHLPVDVVIGVNHPDPAGIAATAANRPSTRVHQNLPSLADLMVRADIMISAGGTTTWERMCLGLPSFVISIAGNQTATQRALHADGYSIFLGEMDEIDDDAIADALFGSLNNRAVLSEQSRKMMALVGGDGASLVAHLMRKYAMKATG